MGLYKKSFIINGKSLFFSEIKFNKDLNISSIAGFLEKYFDDTTTFMVQTSGSTGAPKRMVLQKKHMHASALRTINYLKLKKGDRALLCLPTDKIGGIMMLVRWLVADMDLWIVKPESKPMKEMEVDFDFAAMVPLQVANSLQQLKTISTLIIGGGEISNQLETQLIEYDMSIYHTYGMTETISHVAMRKIGNEFYEALDGVSFYKDDRECLVISDAHLELENLVTNDIVDTESSNKFYWKGRYDNVVNSGGVKLYPEEIEREIGELAFPYFLAGEKDEVLGEKLVMLAEAKEPSDVEKFSIVFESLPKYHRPKAIYWISEFLYTTTNKIRREDTLNKFLKKR